MFSAIQIGGERSHELARAGKEVELAPRAVEVRALRCLAASVPVAGPAASSGASAEAAPEEPVELPSLELDVLVSKGYYVRSLARDLGGRLGVPAHLSALRRVQSGAFTVEGAVSLDAGADVLRARWCRCRRRSRARCRLAASRRRGPCARRKASG